MDLNSVARLLAPARARYVWAACVQPQDDRLEEIVANLQMRWAPWTVLVACRPGARATVTCSKSRGDRRGLLRLSAVQPPAGKVLSADPPQGQLPALPSRCPGPGTALPFWMQVTEKGAKS